jgi:phosphonate transport system substrate-binding protein
MNWTKPTYWLCGILLVLHASLFAQTKERLLFAINEGGISHIVGKDVAPRYKELALELSKILKKPVDIEVAVDYKALKNDLLTDRYDMALIHPTHIAMGAVGSSRFQFIASEKSYTNYQVSFFVPAASALKSLSDLKNPAIRDKTLIAPMQDSVTSALARGVLKETLGNLPPVTYTQQEDALPFSSENGAAELESMLFLLKNGLGAYGVSASNAVINDWKASGGRVIGTSPKVPVKIILANAKLSASEREKISQYFLNLDKSDAGLKQLQRMGFTGFTALEPSKITALVNWFAR